MKCRHQRGFGMIEVMVAALVITVIAIGVIQFEAHRLNDTLQSYYKTIALVQVRGMMDRLRVNHDARFRLKELNEWNKDNQIRLPEGHGQYECTQHAHVCTVKIEWKVKTHQVLAITAVIA